ncbi:MAG: hypothetical protein JST19_00380 [Bacteroidetes bacterium]|nr:hypothetical protein [Bacteroidota bacterium]
MFVRTIISAIIILSGTVQCLGQEVIGKKDRLNDDITEKFFVLKDSTEIKNGQYAAYYHRKHIVAYGIYNNGKKAGKWRFFDPNGRIMEMYDYSTRTLQFEAKDNPVGNISYLLDKNVSDTDRITKPVKIGGRYFGYLPYLGLFKTPFDPSQYTTYGAAAVVELLISPMGRLADFKIHVASNFLDYDQTITMSLGLLKEEDKEFIPATFNGEPVLSRIVIRCKVTDDGGLDFLYNFNNAY